MQAHIYACWVWWPIFFIIFCTTYEKAVYAYGPNYTKKKSSEAIWIFNIFTENEFLDKVL